MTDSPERTQAGHREIPVEAENHEAALAQAQASLEDGGRLFSIRP